MKLIAPAPRHNKSNPKSASFSPSRSLAIGTIGAQLDMASPQIRKMALTPKAAFEIDMFLFILQYYANFHNIANLYFPCSWCCHTIYSSYRLFALLYDLNHGCSIFLQFTELKFYHVGIVQLYKAHIN